VALNAILYPAGRRAERQHVSYPSTLRQDADPIDIEIQDISVTGLRAVSPKRLAPRDKVSVGLAGVGQVAAEVVWGQAPVYGFRFETPLSPGDLASVTPHRNIAHLAPAQPVPVAATARIYGFQERTNGLVSAANVLRSLGLAAGYSIAAIATGLQRSMNRARRS